jgi:hypothetical protein
MAGDETLAEAAENLYGLKGQDPAVTEYNAFLVVQKQGDYRVARFCDLSELWGTLSPSELGSKLLAELPIPAATETISRNTSEPGGKVRDRLKNTPGAVFVIVDENGFVCLFANPERSGSPGGSSFGAIFPKPKNTPKILTCGRGHARVYFASEFTGSGSSRRCKACSSTVTWL